MVDIEEEGELLIPLEEVEEGFIGPLPFIEEIVSSDSESEEDNMALKLPTITADMRFDRRKPGVGTTWSAFRSRLEEWVEWHGEGQVGWTPRHSKRILYFCLGETELLMARDHMIPANISSVDVNHEYGTLKKMLDKCSQVFQPLNESRLAKEGFDRSCQGEHENLDMYLSRLKLLFGQAHMGETVRRQDILVDRFVRGLRNTKARFAINSAETSCFDDISRALTIAKAAISAQIAEAPLSKRDQIAEGLTTANLTQKTSLNLIKSLSEDTSGLSPYTRVMTGHAGEGGSLNQSIAGGGQEAFDEPMEIGAFQPGLGIGAMQPEGEDDAIDIEALVEGMHQEQIFMIGALQRGDRDISKLKCFYCDVAGHFIATCYKRQTDIRNGTYKKRPASNYRRGAGRGAGSGQRGNFGRGSRGNTRGRGNGANRGSYSAGMAPAEASLPLAEEGNYDDVDEQQARIAGDIGAMTLAPGELEEDLEMNYTQGIGASDGSFGHLV